MEDLFGDIFRHKLAQGGGNPSIIRYEQDSAFSLLDTMNDMYLSLVKPGYVFAIHILELKAIRPIYIYQSSCLVGKIPKRENTEAVNYLVYACELGGQYKRVINTCSKADTIFLDNNPRGVIRKIRHHPVDILLDLKETITILTREKDFKLNYISHRLLSEMQNKIFSCEEGNKIFSLPMSIICSKISNKFITTTKV